MKKQALTLKYNSSELNKLPDKGNRERKRMYLEWCKLARSKGVTPYDLKFELGETKILHIHGKILYPDDWSYAKLNKALEFPNTHVFLRELYDEPGWSSYSNKEIAVAAAKQEAVPVPWIGTPTQRQTEAAATVQLLRPIPKHEIEFGWGV